MMRLLSCWGEKCCSREALLLFLQAPANSTELHNYSRGVQMGCWGLVGYAVVSAVCSGNAIAPSLAGQASLVTHLVQG